MTTAEATSTLDFNIPEQLPERSFTSVYRVVKAEANFPPAALQAKIGGTPRLNIHFALEPLDFKYVSDRAKGFEDDLEHVWLPVYDKNGDPSPAGSNLDHAKQAWLKLGFPIRNSADLVPLVGQNFVFENKRITRTFKKNRINTQTNETEQYDEESTSYIVIPVGPAPDDYKHEGPTKIINRPRTTVTPTAANVADNAADALPVLMNVLNGVAEADYFDAIVSTKDPTINRKPYATEAASDPAALTRRMLEAGMSIVDGVLVKS